MEASAPESPSQVAAGVRVKAFMSRWVHMSISHFTEKNPMHWCQRVKRIRLPFMEEFGTLQSKYPITLRAIHCVRVSPKAMMVVTRSRATP
jgi:hypothetical protein